MTLSSLAIATARVASGAFGAALLYMGLFMYQDERGGQQNRLVNLWVRVREREEASVAALPAFLQACSLSADKCLTMMFGHRLFSWRAALTSQALTMVSISSFACFGHILNPTENPNRFFYMGLKTYLYIFLFSFLILRGSLRAVDKGRYRRMSLWFYLLVEIYVLELSSQLFGAPTSFSETIVTLIAGTAWILPFFIASFAVDLVFLAASRRMVRVMAEHPTATSLFTGVVWNGLWAAATVLFCLSFARVGGGPVSDILAATIYRSPRTWQVATTIGATGLFSAVVAFSVLLTAIVAVAHRLIWPIAGRTLNALYESEILSNKKIQVSVGAGCLSVALPNLSRLLSHLKL